MTIQRRQQWGYVQVMSFLHTQLDRWNVSQWIRFKTSVVNVLSGFSHIEDALEFSVASDDNAATMTEMQLVTANALLLLVLEKACENDTIIMNKIWGEGFT